MLFRVTTYGTPTPLRRMIVKEANETVAVVVNKVGKVQLHSSQHQHG